MSAALHLSARAAHTLRRRAGRGYPAEVCGLLLGRETAAGVDVHRAVRLPNRARCRDRAYRLDPADYLRCERRARAAGLDVVGVWHSHPDGEACPSATDARLAWPRWCYLIAAVDGGGVRALRAWTLRAGRFRQLAIDPCPR